MSQIIYPQVRKIKDPHPYRIPGCRPSERNHAGVEAAFWKKPNGREKGSDSTLHLAPNGTPFKKSGKTFKQGREEMLEK
jgi:hypothetical protein